MNNCNNSNSNNNNNNNHILKIKPKIRVKKTIIRNKSKTKNNISNNERLFWKVFRNKYLFYLIIDNLSTYKQFRCNIYKYNEIISVKWMIENQYLALLKYKVSRNEYLVFGNCTSPFQFNSIYYNINFNTRNNNINNNNYNFNSNNNSNNNNNNNNNNNSNNINSEMILFKLIKSNCFEFYRELFSNYKYYFISTPNTIENTANLIIEMDNKIAFQVLVNQFKFKFKFIQILLKAFEFGSFEILEYLISTNSTPLTSEEENEIFKEILLSKDASLLNNQIDFLLNSMKLKLPNNNNNNNFRFSLDLNIFKIPLKLLYETFKTLSKFEENYNNNNNNNYEENFNKFTDEELNRVVGEFDSDNEIVKSLFQKLIPYTNKYNWVSFKAKDYQSINYSFYQIKYFQNYFNNCGDFNPLSFGDYQQFKLESLKKVFKKDNKNKNQNQNQNNTLNLLYLDSILFEYCNFDFKKKENFILQYLNDYNNNNNNSNNNNNNKLKPLILFQILVKRNELELLKLFFNNSSELVKEDLYNNDIFSYINSESIFDFIISITKFSQTPTIIINQLFQHSKIELIQYYKNNYSIDYYNSLKLIDFSKIYNFKIFKYIYNNLNDFNNNNDNNLNNNNNQNNNNQNNLIKNLKINIEDNELDKEEFKFFVNNLSIDKFYNIRFAKYKYSSYDWLNQKGKSFLDRCIVDNKDCIDIGLYQYYKNNNNNLMSMDNYNSTPPYKLIDEIFKRSDLKTLDLIMNKFFKTKDYNNDTKSTFFYNGLLLKSSQYGSIDIFKFIHSNYPWLFKLKRTNSNSSDFSSGIGHFESFNNDHHGGEILESELNQIINSTLINGHIDLMIYYFQIFKHLGYPFKILIYKDLNFNNLVRVIRNKYNI
ncbi:hypothetical protein ACTFIW_008495 [Dictyostelium discoideum]